MSIKLMSKVWDDSRYSGERLLLLLAIADSANEANGMVCWPSIRYLSSKIRASERYTRTLIQEIINAPDPELRIVRRGGGRSANQYKINEDNLGRSGGKKNNKTIEIPVLLPAPLPVDSASLRDQEKTPDPQIPPARIHRSPQPGSPDQSKHNITVSKHNLEERSSSERQALLDTAQAKREEALVGVRRALEKSTPYLDASGLNVIDLADYPEDIRPILARVCQLYNLRPPRKGSRKGGEFSLWISSGRELVDAAGEIGIPALERARRDFASYMDNHDGQPPFTVSGPGSLVKTVRSVAAKMRTEAIARTAARSQSEDPAELDSPGFFA